jgi:hypothetical protein
MHSRSLEFPRCSLFSLLKLKIVKKNSKSFCFLVVLFIGHSCRKFIKNFSIQSYWNFQHTEFSEIVKNFAQCYNSCTLCKMFILSFVVKSFIDYITCCFKFAKSVSIVVCSLQLFPYRCISKFHEFSSPQVITKSSSSTSVEGEEHATKL